MYCPSGSVDPENSDGNIAPPNIWSSRYRQNAISMRDALKVYVNIGEVKVAWQLYYERTT